MIAERELLEETLHGSVAALLDTLALANPMAFARATRIQQIVRELVQELQTPDAWCIEVAAMLSQVGTVVLRPDTVGKLHNGRPLDADEREQVSHLPRIAEQLLARIPRLDAVRQIIRDQGIVAGAHGAIDGRQNAETVIGARLLRVAADLDTLQASGLSRLDAVAALERHQPLYDPTVIAALRCRLEGAMVVASHQGNQRGTAPGGYDH